jgi:NAD(P)H-hydrate epimerase
MAALTGLSVEEIQNNRMEIARRFSKEWRQVVVLKGANSIVASPEGNLAILPFASSALAKAGTGDVLAGIIAGLITQGVRPFEAALAGVWVHAQAAKEVVKHQGSEACLLASDLLEAIPLVLSRK